VNDPTIHRRRGEGYLSVYLYDPKTKPIGNLALLVEAGICLDRENLWRKAGPVLNVAAIFHAYVLSKPCVKWSILESGASYIRIEHAYLLGKGQLLY
jgi:hypothetical protein